MVVIPVTVAVAGAPMVAVGMALAPCIEWLNERCISARILNACLPRVMLSVSAKLFSELH